MAPALKFDRHGRGSDIIFSQRCAKTSPAVYSIDDGFDSSTSSIATTDINFVAVRPLTSMGLAK